jgi:hypothetical protein
MLVSARQRLRRQRGERGVITQALDKIGIGDASSALARRGHLDPGSVASKGYEHLGQQAANQDIILDDQEARRVHDATSSPAPPSFTHASS